MSISITLPTGGYWYYHRLSSDGLCANITRFLNVVMNILPYRQIILSTVSETKREGISVLDVTVKLLLNIHI